MIEKNSGSGDPGNEGGEQAIISDLYPGIAKITLFVAVEQADEESEPSYQQIIFTGETEAAFHLECSREECLVGGFDFAPIVEELVKSGDSRGQGTLECWGTLGPLGPRCSLKAEYRIIIE